jgi:hypothetical protein
VELAAAKAIEIIADRRPCLPFNLVSRNRSFRGVVGEQLLEVAMEYHDLGDDLSGVAVLLVAPRRT